MEAAERTMSVCGQAERKPWTIGRGGSGVPAVVIMATAIPCRCRVSRKCRVTLLMVMSSAKLATFETDAMKAAAGAGAPS
jgi:hypothetical protein